MIFSFSAGQSVNAEVECLQAENAKKAAEDFIKSYYYSMYTDSEVDLYGRTKYRKMADYLSVKLNNQQKICGEVENYKVYTYTLSVEESEKAFLFDIYSAVEFNYLEADFNSSFAVSNQIIVEKGGEHKILDVMIGWGLDDSLLGRDSLDLNTCFWERDEITEEAIAEICDYMEEAMVEEHIQVSAVPDIEGETYSVNSVTPSVSFGERNLMVAYATTNTRILCPEENGGISGQEITPVSGNPNLIPEYYDFSVVAPGNYDCTNFTSHCLLAGGAKMNTSSAASGWFFKNMSSRSYSWSSVNSFYTFVTTNKGVGPKAVVGKVSCSTERKLVNCETGDIIQIDYQGDGNFDHNVMITGVALSSDGKFWPAVSGRSGSNSGHAATQNIALPECRKAAQTSKVVYRLLHLTSLK